MEEFGIIVYGHSRPLHIADVLESLQKQHALKYTHVWIDGHQNVSAVKQKVELVNAVVDKFPVASKRSHTGALGFRKMLLQSLIHTIQHFETFLVLEDDCFPTSDAVASFQVELSKIRDQPEIFSVYGHHFLMPCEDPVCTRFQGWGWGTTSEKLKPILEQLIQLYSVTEEEYLAYVRSVLTDEIIDRLDVTPPRLPTACLTRFFAWDETVALLAALARMVHKKTPKRTIYNCGIGGDSSRFKSNEMFFKPPFNIVPHEKIWQYY